MVNNAGLFSTEPLLEDPEGFDLAIEVMLKAPYRLTAAAVPGMAVRGYGRVVNISSDMGSFDQGLVGPNAYGIAKAALNALTVATAREVPDCIKINATAPGWVRTRMGGDQAPRSVEVGADTAVWLAGLPADGPTGGFFKDRAAIAW